MLVAMMLLQLVLGAALVCEPESAAPRAIASAHRTHGAHDAGRSHRDAADETCRREARSCENATHDAACALASVCAPAAIAERARADTRARLSHARPECVLERLTSRDLAPDDPPPRPPA